MNCDFWWQFFQDHLRRFCAGEMGVFLANQCPMSGCDGTVLCERSMGMVGWKCSKCGHTFGPRRMREWQDWQKELVERHRLSM